MALPLVLLLILIPFEHFYSGYHTYTFNDTTHTAMETDEILSVRYEDGGWGDGPYYDCGGGNIWMMTYSVPFFGFKWNFTDPSASQNGSYYFK